MTFSFKVIFFLFLNLRTPTAPFIDKSTSLRLRFCRLRGYRGRHARRETPIPLSGLLKRSEIRYNIQIHPISTTPLSTRPTVSLHEFLAPHINTDKPTTQQRRQHDRSGRHQTRFRCSVRHLDAKKCHKTLVSSHDFCTLLHPQFHLQINA